MKEQKHLDQFLNLSESYGTEEDVTCIETHISWVYLVGSRAYKRKKPLKMDFLDYSTLELRYEACRAELALNRRLCPDVYLDCIPVFEKKDGSYSFENGTQIVDWLVKMKRLPQDRMLDVLMKSNRKVTEGELAALAKCLNEFFAGLEKAPLDPKLYFNRLRQHIVGNKESLEQVFKLDYEVRRSVMRTTSQQLISMYAFRKQIGERAKELVEGHGDLRPENICMTEKPQVFDCVEFSSEYRTLDPIDELAFVAMELECLKGAAEAQTLIEMMTVPIKKHETLFYFYKSYRAYVRAKIAALRSQQVRTAEALEHREQCQKYLDLAESYQAWLSRPMIILVGGLMGSGKTSLATDLADHLSCLHLSTDKLRIEVFGRSERNTAEYGQGVYSPSSRRAVYEKMMTQCERELKDGMTVILDGSFIAKDSRDKVMSLADGLEVPVVSLWCQCPAEIAEKRIQQRLIAEESHSEARPELHKVQMEEVDADLEGFTAIIDTTQSKKSALDYALRVLSESFEGGKHKSVRLK